MRIKVKNRCCNRKVVVINRMYLMINTCMGTGKYTPQIKINVVQQYYKYITPDTFQVFLPESASLHTDERRMNIGRVIFKST